MKLKYSMSISAKSVMLRVKSLAEVHIYKAGDAQI